VDIQTNVAAIKTDGTLWVWGANSSGQLGLGNIINRSSPVQEISLSTNWKKLFVANDHKLALKLDNTLWGWGTGGQGMLNNSSTLNRSSPVQIIENTYSFKDIGGFLRTSMVIKAYPLLTSQPSRTPTPTPSPTPI
jgi:alpha-tubulin suppressor-like RCC1 family protein